MSGVIARHWGASVRRADLAGWVDTYRERVLPHMRDIEGWQGVSFLAAPEGDPCRVSVTTLWKDEAALRRFSGGDLTTAVVPDFMQGFFVDSDSHATIHTEIFAEMVN